MLMRVIRWDDGNVVALDERGNKIADLNGPYELVREKVLRDATGETKFLKGMARYGITEPVKREEW
jgi:hypothetical protein